MYFLRQTIYILARAFECFTSSSLTFQQYLFDTLFPNFDNNHDSNNKTLLEKWKLINGLMLICPSLGKKHQDCLK